MDKIVIVIGPTAVGKTKLGVELAKEINGEIISMDSMQVYTELDILTNKVTTEEAQNVPHHLISEVDCEHQFNANQFVARAGIEDLEVSSTFLEYFLISGMSSDGIFKIHSLNYFPSSSF